ncbi:GIY-YIG nuclease family protein [Motiliproteus sediminis]|uniref:GIY-YIG nuclease family protein n=1 Tax=Motiliproteus sediminis TaxID=1468178 RepID=UPI001AEFBA4D|nr:GIY-YIG nuclease family protein [Motiliproteus sediminis]
MTASTGWYLYIIETEGGRLYTGITTDPQRRFTEHQCGRGAKFFRSDPPRRQVYCCAFPDRSSASREEYRIKQLSRTEKLRLIGQTLR